MMSEVQKVNYIYVVDSNGTPRDGSASLLLLPWIWGLRESC